MTQAMENRITDPEKACLIEREFEADDTCLPEVLAFLEEELERHDAGTKQMMALSLALEEAFVNVAHYAYENMPQGKAWVSLSFEGDQVFITLKDRGMEFDPLANKDPDITASAEDRQIGGLGIFMIKKSTDSCSYKRENGYNILTMAKTIR